MPLYRDYNSWFILLVVCNSLEQSSSSLDGMLSELVPLGVDYEWTKSCREKILSFAHFGKKSKPKPKPKNRSRLRSMSLSVDSFDPEEEESEDAFSNEQPEDAFLNEQSDEEFSNKQSEDAFSNEQPDDIITMEKLVSFLKGRYGMI